MSFTYDSVPNTVRQEVYEAQLEKSLDNWLIGRPLFADKTGVFPDGDVLKTTKTGDRAVSDYTENTAISFGGMDTARTELVISQSKQDAFFITDKMKNSAWQAEAFFQENIRKSGIALATEMEIDCLAVANQQTLANPNIINGAPHRFKGSGTGGALTIRDIQRIKFAFDKAKVPVQNRVLIITPEMEDELNALLNITEVTNGGSTFNYNFDGLVQTGFGSELNFVRNIAGINIMISHFLPEVTAENLAIYDGSGGGNITGKLCVAMSLADESSMPFQCAIRQRPVSEFERNVTYKRDEWSSTCEYGFGLKRAETLVTVATPV